jgi:hypothetical protein
MQTVAGLRGNGKDPIRLNKELTASTKQYHYAVPRRYLITYQHQYLMEYLKSTNASTSPWQHGDQEGFGRPVVMGVRFLG